MVCKSLSALADLFSFKTSQLYLQNSFNVSLRPLTLASVIARLAQPCPGGGVVHPGTKARLQNLKTGEFLEVELVYPQQHDPDSGRYSVLSDLGEALLGCTLDDLIEVDVPGGPVLFQILSLNQPRPCLPA